MFTRCFLRRRIISARWLCSISKILSDGPQSDPVTLHGWIRHRREHKTRTFLVLADGLSADTVQIVFEGSEPLHTLRPGAAVRMTGNLVPSGGRGQKYDFIPNSVDVVGENDAEDYPLDEKEKCEEGTVRQFLHLRPRMISFSALLRLRNAAKRWLHNYLQDRNFLSIDTPIFTSNDCEGAGEAFYVEPADKVKFGDAVIRQMESDGTEREIRKYFFSKPVYTTVSGQLHLEAAACSLRRVYTFNPTFRAESCLSRHHLAEFYMLEVEMAFVDSLEPLIDMVETIFRECSQALLNEHAVDYTAVAKFHNASHMKAVEKTLASSGPFPRLSYKEAMEIIKQGAAEGHCSVPRKGALTKEQETYLVKHCGDQPLFVMRFPSEAKPFYMAQCSDDPETAACFDFLVPLAGELVGGGLRESDYSTLQRRLIAMGLHEKLAWYLDLRKYGHPRTGGFGLGFERYLQWLLGVNSIKDCLPFPRWYNHCYL